MIKVDETKITIKGKIDTVLAELGMMVRVMRKMATEEYGEAGDYMIMEAINVAFMSDEEVKEKTKEMAKELFIKTAMKVNKQREDE